MVSIIEQFEVQALLQPKEVAIVEFSPETQAFQTYTFSQINEYANKFANYLQSLSQNDLSNTNIVLFTEPNVHYRIAILAILKLRATIVPIDPSFPPFRINLITQEVNPSLIIDNKILEKFQSHLEKLDGNNLSKSTNEDKPILILYTSGSTGNPKGVVFKDTNLCIKIETTAGVINYDPTKDISVCMTNPIFDIAWFEMLLSLISGGVQAVAKKSIANNPSELDVFIAKVKQFGLNIILQGTPTHLQMIGKHIKAYHSRTLENITVLLVGEPLRLNLVELLRHCGTTTIYNFYGPTEGMVWNSFKLILDKGIQNKISIGAPLPCNNIHILDENKNEVPFGEIGHIHISGNLAEGYYLKPELTKSKFLFINDKMMYDTGDLGKLNETAELEYIGREDTQVKVMGNRIELGEIEQTLSSYPKVETATAVVIGNNEGLMRIAAFIEPKPIDCNISIGTYEEYEKFKNWKTTSLKGDLYFLLKKYWKVFINLGDENFTDVSLTEQFPFIKCLSTYADGNIKSQQIEELKILLAIYPLFSNYTLHLTEEELRKFCIEKLPLYALPSYIYLTKKIKKTANMKADRVSLAKIAERRIMQFNLPSPRSNIEADFSADFKDVLLSKLRRNHLPENFTTVTLQYLGADSIVINELSVIIHLRYGVTLPRNFLFQKPTIQDIIDYICKLQQKNIQPEIPNSLVEDSEEIVEIFRAQSFFGENSVEPVLYQSETIYPLTFAQTRLLILSTPEDKQSSAAFNLYKAYKITGEISLDALRLALHELLINQKILRTLYQPVSKTIAQRIVPESQLASYLQIHPFQPFNTDALNENKHTICTLNMVNAPIASIEEALHIKFTQVFNLFKELSWRLTVIKTKEKYTFDVCHSLTKNEIKERLKEQDVGFILFTSWENVWKAYLVINEEKDYEEIIVSIPSLLKTLNNPKKSKDNCIDLIKRTLAKKNLFQTIIAKEDEYYLGFCFQHICIDPYSINIVLREINRLYAIYKEAFDQKKAMPLIQHNSISLQIHDIAFFELNNKRKILSDRRKEYWKKNLKDIRPLHIPTEFKRKPTDIDHPGEETNFTISSKTVNEIIKFSALNNITLFTFLTSATYILLYHLTGQNDLTIATTLSTREDPKKMPLIGFQIEIVPLRQFIDPNLSFKEFILQVSEKINEARKSYLPFQELIKLLNQNGSDPFDHKKMPLLHAGIIYIDESSNTTLELKGAIIEEKFYTLPLISKLDVTLYFYKQCNGELRCVAEYSKLLFTKQSVENAIIRPLQKLFKDIIIKSQKSDILIKELNLLPVAIQQKIALSKSIFLEKESIWQKLFKYTEKEDEYIKLICDGKTLTNKQLIEYSKKIAQYLINEEKITPGSLIALIFPENINRYLFTIAVTLCGCTYLPIDPDDLQYQKRLKKRLSYVDFVIAEKCLSNLFLSEKAETILADDFTISQINKKFDGNFQAYYNQKTPVCAFATSGTTGEPKIVLLKNHAGLLNLITHLKSPSVYNLPDTGKPEDRKFLSIYGHSSDGYTYAMWLGLFSRCQIYLTNDFGTTAGIKSIISPELLSFISTHQITHIPVIPSNGAQIICSLAKDELNSVRHIGIAGGIFPIDIIDSLPNCTLTNLYGPSETWICASTYTILKDKPIQKNAYIPIGSPRPDFKFFVLQEDLNISQEKWGHSLPYAYGRLFIKCPYEMEYLGEKELTEKAFINHKKFGKIYDTHDIVQYTGDNLYIFNSRKEEFIRLNNYRIDLKEIEQCILSHPQIEYAQAGFNHKTQAICVSAKPKEQVEDETLTLQKILRNMYMKTYDELFHEKSENVLYLGWDNELSKDSLDAKDLIAINEYDARQIMRYLPERGSTLINVGCGMSTILKNLFELGGESGAKFDSISLFDYSETVINVLKNQHFVKPTEDFCKKITIHKADAEESFINSKPVDIILLISVVQYFSHYTYLYEVFQRALPQVKEDGGVIYLGDIRDYRLLRIFHYEKLLLSENYSHLSTKDWALLAEHATENQLFVGIEYFLGMARLCELESNGAFYFGIGVKLRHRQFRPTLTNEEEYATSSRENDLLPYRLTYIFQRFTKKPQKLDIPWKTWTQDMNLENLKSELESIINTKETIIAYKGVPNSRLWGIKSVLESMEQCTMVADLEEVYEKALVTNQGIEPDILIGLADKFNLDLHIMPSYEPYNLYTYDVIFYPQNKNAPTFFINIQYPHLIPSISGINDLGLYANNPTKSLSQQQLLYQVWSTIERELPTHSRPKTIVFTDRNDLKPDEFPSELHMKKTYNFLAAPRNELDCILLTIWKKVLNQGTIGINDNFFECTGGTSITAAHMIFLIKEQLNINFGINTIYKYPTIFKLSNYIQAIGYTTKPAVFQPVRRSSLGSKEESLPKSPPKDDMRVESANVIYRPFK